MTYLARQIVSVASPSVDPVVPFSPDGRWAATSAQVFAPATGARRCALPPLPGWGLVAFAPDGGRVVTSHWEGNAVVMSDAATGAERWRVTNDQAVYEVRWSPDGRWVGAVSDAAVRVLDAATGVERTRCAGLPEPDQTRTFSWSPDGTRIAVGHGVGFFSSAQGGVRVFDAATGAERNRIELGTWANMTCWSPDGRLVGAGCGDGGAVLVDAAAGTLRVRLVEPRGIDAQVEDVRFDRDGRRVVTAGRDGAVRVFDVATGAPLSLYDHGHQAFHAVFSPDGRWVAASGSGGAVLFDAATGAERCRLTRGSAGPVTFGPDGSRASVGTYLRARIFDPAAHQERLTVRHGGAVGAVAVSPDGRWFASGCADGVARVLDARTGAERCRLAHGGPVRGVAFAPDGAWVATAGEDATARVFDAETGSQRARFDHEGAVLTVVVGGDGAIVATGSEDGTLRVFGVAGLAQRFRRSHGGAVLSVAISRDGELVATGCADGTARVFTARTGTEQAQFAHEGVVGSVSFTPDGASLATACADGFARLFEIGTGTERLRLEHLDDDFDDPVRVAVEAVAVSPSGTTLATTAADTRLRLFTLPSGELRTAAFHWSRIWPPVFSADGALLAVASDDQTGTVYDTTGNQRALLVHDSGVRAVALAPDATWLVTGSADGTARITDIT
ncbi:WD40 repeat domain-containing protein [Actinomadura graeca]|uniref:WD40 repeat domain-containing protein n=1 Tax=Actinomadura graeca TaxID=2750812 RepID=A0ABX8QSU8_9ACTN|nr:WD40 repeat domain-containing protein [Actinomadura graeca]QXJ21259.1 WD40 repeat domain-containing protein [Actinomadura graeca]